MKNMKDKPRTKINFYVPKKDMKRLLDQIDELTVHLDISMSKLIRVSIEEKHDKLVKTLIQRYIPIIKTKIFPDPIIYQNIMHEEGNLKIIEEVITNARL